ncbi:hypothetical protein, partial [Endozoicomonas atrinae]|uniref:hypothetical protein n=1 Tax=Endozoicomonas atrinae TaxID=1333660 RepID=UPI001930F83C
RQDVETRQTDIIARQSDITTKQTDITTKHTQVEADRAEVETRQSDIIAIQSDITTKQTDITTKHGEVQSNTTLAGTYKDEAKTYRDEAKNYADTVTGGIVELGNYDASTNTLPAKPTTSAFWKITAAGTLNGISYGVGDSLVYSLSSDTFYKIDNTEAVTSVNGHQGVVSLTYNDVSAHPNTWVPSWA